MSEGELTAWAKSRWAAAMAPKVPKESERAPGCKEVVSVSACCAATGAMENRDATVREATIRRIMNLRGDQW
jgi:hypothetical protein